MSCGRPGTPQVATARTTSRSGWPPMVTGSPAGWAARPAGDTLPTLGGWSVDSLPCPVDVDLDRRKSGLPLPVGTGRPPAKVGDTVVEGAAPVSKRAPAAAYSPLWLPTPRPSRTRPPDTRSSDTAALATAAGLRSGNCRTPVPSLRRLVPAARQREHHECLEGCCWIRLVPSKTVASQASRQSVLACI